MWAETSWFSSSYLLQAHWGGFRRVLDRRLLSLLGFILRCLALGAARVLFRQASIVFGSWKRGPGRFWKLLEIVGSFLESSGRRRRRSNGSGHLFTRTPTPFRCGFDFWFPTFAYYPAASGPFSWTGGFRGQGLPATQAIVFRKS